MNTLSFWQDFAAETELDPPFSDRYRVRLGERSIDLPIRPLPNGERAVASLLVNHASFPVMDMICTELAEIARKLEPDLVVGMPTLGLSLAESVARSCGHQRYVPLGTSRKFWYDEKLSAPLSSITTPQKGKRLYLDPNLKPLFDQAKRVLIVDDVVSTGASLESGATILRSIGHSPIGALCVMTQGTNWQGKFDFPVLSCFSSPILTKIDGNWWPA